MRGKLIVVEGLDRAGKTTQCARLHARLAERGPVELLKFPDRTTTIGKMIDAYLRSDTTLPDETIHLLFSANRWEAAEALRTKLAAGTTLVVDRYVYSGIAFSAAKGLDLEWCRRPDVGLPAADLVVFLDVSPAAAEARGGYGEERYERREFQQKVRAIFEQLAGPAWRWVSADASEDAVAAEVWQAVQAILGLDAPLGTFA